MIEKCIEILKRNMVNPIEEMRNAGATEEQIQEALDVDYQRTSESINASLAILGLPPV